ncbi:sel1 repeat family protein [Marinobacterium sp. AK62]|uniref:Sel1 repeat family protein n=1 Tax=Marinobacterium alkalitolerans TaxID=1542925 RepID=A0ABS3ZBW8_9GAMM|nr:SEL1-like repeat protein [Marinobacterium alkalitolerans]MBP0049111.1 sel1 repeat family protein [Marinobacterium alkalitolerans]
MRLLTRVTAPLLGWLAARLFHFPLFKRSRLRHRMAMKLFRVAAEGGSCSALSTYGHLLHFRGEDHASRVQGGIYLERAADLGDARAQYQMGRIYEQGFEPYFRPDAVKALAYYRSAGEQGHPLAVKRMIEVYDEGVLGAAIDPARAECWRKRQQPLPDVKA